VHGYSYNTAVGVLESSVTSALAYDLETGLLQGAQQFCGFEYQKTGHQTRTFRTPTNSGNSDAPPHNGQSVSPALAAGMSGTRRPKHGTGREHNRLTLA